VTAGAERAAAWMYRGIWGILVQWLKVPDHAPELPTGESVRVSRPAPAFLSYLKFLFWLLLLPLDTVLIVVWLVLLVAVPIVGVLLTVPILVVAIVPDIVAYIALHLRFDTTWYALSDRSMRIRRGIWVISETTITYENIQNVTVSQGPLQRYFGIADVVVQTAGGGSGGRHGESGATHIGKIEGIANAAETRDLVMARVKQSRSAGLGDEHHPHALPVEGGAAGWTAEHLAVLRDVRELSARLAG
jgi:membrane protein YdbS with pleckstrin-like domain